MTAGAEALAGALEAAADGICTDRAGVGLLIRHGTWLTRDDFTSRHITTAPGMPDPAVLMAVIDWEGAIAALDAGGLPCSSGERRVLRVAASIAGGTPVSLSDALPGIDPRTAELVISAVSEAAGQRPPGAAGPQRGFAVPSAVPVPQDEPEAGVPAGTVGEAAELLALAAALLEAEPEAGTAAARFLEARGADPLPALTWLIEGTRRVASELQSALDYEGIACDRILPRYWRRR